jgi:MULE transposase domain
MSPSQQDLYQRFHDIVLNDNTCKTNKYNMYLSVFMIKDNYGKFRNVANALVEDELASTYIWILQCLMKATDNIAPKAFWTDSEPGLINAAAHVFPMTPHFYCLFHIWQNIIKHLKAKLGTTFRLFGKAFYACRNTLSTELFEQKWEFLINSFPESRQYMTKVLYPNRCSWAKAYMPFQFNAGIQSTQSVESFNAIIKKALNSASSLCDIEKAIDKRHEAELQYCQLVNLKAYQTTVGLPHLSSQFFSSIDTVLNHFLTPLVLSWQKFQISQSLTYEGYLVSSLLNEVSIILLKSNGIFGKAVSYLLCEFYRI